MLTKSTVSKALRAAASALEELGQADLDALIAGKGRLVFVPVEKTSPKPELLNLDANAVIERLNACENRDDAQKLLASVESKDRLLAIARSLRVHVVKHDRREDVEGKLIAFAIGGKLRTEALQTLNLRGGSADG